MLARYAGMSSSNSSFGIYGYLPQNDVNDLTARQITQMLWYFIDGKSRSKQEAALDDRHNFNEFHSTFTEVDTVFTKQKQAAGGCSCLIKSLLPAAITIMYVPAIMKYPNAG